MISGATLVKLGAIFAIILGERITICIEEHKTSRREPWKIVWNIALTKSGNPASGAKQCLSTVILHSGPRGTFASLFLTLADLYWELIQ
jgi:hypothetical protein